MLFPRPANADAAQAPLLAPIKRRSFLTYAGATALVLAGCQKNDATPGATDVGSGDIGVLNLVYAIEQLQLAFYTKVLAGKYFAPLAATSAEHQLFSDLAQHEQVHAAFWRTTLTTNALKMLNTKLDDQVDFDARTTASSSGKMGVLNAARVFEDLGVATYNGAARFLTTANYLTLLSKIVSVEARHAALIRDLLVAGGDTSLGTGFIGSDVVDATSRQEKSLSPTDALLQLNTFLAADSQLTAIRLI